jgi:integrase/recombinase XerD
VSDPRGAYLVPTATDPAAFAGQLVALGDRHPVAVYLARLAPGSRRTMRQALDAVAATIAAPHTAETLPWPAVGYQHVAAVRAALLEGGKAPATVNKTLAAVRGVLKECWRLGLVDGEHYQRAADVQGVRATTLPRGRALAGGDLMALMRWCAQDATPRGARDAALLALLYGGGLRRSEAVAAEVADYDPETGALTVRHGKGDKARVADLTNGAQTALADWLLVRGEAPGALLCPVNKRGAVTIRRMDDTAVRKILLRLAGQAAVRPFSPHDLRRTFISDLLQAQVDISTVQRLAGHANVQTTARYDRRGEQTKREGASKLHLPYYGRPRRSRREQP